MSVPKYRIDRARYGEVFLDPERAKECFAGNSADSNQRAAYERIVERYLRDNPDADLPEADRYARRQVASEAPTAQQAAREIASLRLGPAYCYLAFFGLDDTANYLKVGLSRHPERRLYGMATGNPLDCLWVYVARYPTAASAYGAEQALLRHMVAHKRHGEWLSIGNTDANAAAALARQLGGQVKGEFVLLGVSDGG